MLFPAFEKTMGEVTGPTLVRRAEHVEIRRRLDHAATMLAERDQAAAKKAADALTAASLRYPYARLVVILIRPSKYDDDLYVIRHLRGTVPRRT